MKTVLDIEHREILVPADRVELTGDLSLPDSAIGLVVFAHGSGSSRHSPRNRHVAGVLNQGAIATILIDLLTEEEEAVDLRTAELRFDIDLLVRRLTAITDWVGGEPDLKIWNRVFRRQHRCRCRSWFRRRASSHGASGCVPRGRPDLAGPALSQVRAPCLFIVGGDDSVVLGLNRAAIAELPPPTRRHLEIVPGATHLFEERGALARVALLARDWFQKYLNGSSNQ